VARRQFGGVRQLPSGSWQAYYPGMGGRRTSAPTTFPSERAAIAWLDRLESDRERGSWYDPALGRQRLDAYAIAWLKTRTVRDSTREYYAQLLDTHILPLLGTRELRQLAPPMIREWHAGLASTTGPTARARSYSLLRTILGEAVRDGALTANPCIIRGAATVDHAEKRPLTIREVRRVAARMPHRYRLLVLLAAASGLRYGELVALRREDINLATMTVSVTKAVRKGREGLPKSAAGVRIVHLPALLKPLIVAHLMAHVGADQTSQVFTTSLGNPPSNNHLNRTLTRAAANIGRPDVRFHHLRHTGATLAAQAGATTKELMARLGHASPRAALLYQHASDDRDAMIAKALDAAATGAPEA
jgi:integrase